MRRFSPSSSQPWLFYSWEAFLFRFRPAAAKKPFTFEDMMSLKRIGGPVISPDGKWVLFAAVDVDLKENKRTSISGWSRWPAAQRGNSLEPRRVRAVDTGHPMARAIST